MFNVSSRITAVVLLTRSFAGWLLDDKFLLKLVRATWRDVPDAQESEQTLQLLVAVVDRIPGQSSGGIEGSSDVTIESQVDEISSSFIGHEGFAILAQSGTDLCQDLWCEPSEQQDILSGNGSGCAALTFRPRHHGGTTGVSMVSELQLPLASTIFETGDASTMFWSTWKRRSSDENLSMLGKRKISHQVVSIPGSFFKPNQVAMDIPLVPLTQPRMIKDCMGNIISRLTMEDIPDATSSATPEAEKAVVPASTELEGSVSSYFATMGVPPHAVNVWALIIPQRLARTALYGDENRLQARRDVAESQRSNESIDIGSISPLGAPTSDLYIWNLLGEGASLRRVLSGGGGWGAKAGLLSLDPDPSPETPEVESSQDSYDSLPYSRETEQPMKAFTKRGDYIQFFVAPPFAQPHASRPSIRKINFRTGTRLSFGVIPSTIDAVPERSNVGDMQKHPSDFELIRGHFGMLSERGMRLTLGRYAPNLSHKPGLADFVTSKIDVPYTLLSAMRMPSVDEQSGVGRTSPGKRSWHPDTVTVADTGSAYNMRSVSDERRRSDMVMTTNMGARPDAGVFSEVEGFSDVGRASGVLSRSHLGNSSEAERPASLPAEAITQTSYMDRRSGNGTYSNIDQASDVDNVFGRGIAGEDPVIGHESVAVPFPSMKYLLGMNGMDRRLLEGLSGCQIFPLPKVDTALKAGFFVIVGQLTQRQTAKRLIKGLVEGTVGFETDGQGLRTVVAIERFPFRKHIARDPGEEISKQVGLAGEATATDDVASRRGLSNPAVIEDDVDQVIERLYGSSSVWSRFPDDDRF